MIKNLYKIKHETVLYVILLFVVGLWFLVLNWNTPFMHDDLAYHYYYDSDSAVERPTSEPITSFWQIFPSMWHHYNAVNGRFTSHFIIQLFCGLLGKSVFNFFNTFVFILFCDLIVVLTSEKRKLLPLSIVVASVMSFLPFPGQTMLWLTGSVNYLWSATFSLIVLQFLTVGRRRSFAVTLMLFLFSVFAGWMNESISFGIGGGLVVYFFMHRERFVGCSRWIVLGYLLGCILILLSPGTMNRAASGEINTELTILQMVSSRIINSFFTLKEIPIILIVLLVLLASCINRFSFLVEGGSLLIVTFLSTTLFCFLLGLTDHRVYFGLSTIGTMIIVITVCNFLSHYHINKSAISILTTLVLFLCLPQGIIAIGKTRGYSVYSTDVEKRILTSPPKCVIEAKPITSSRFVYATTVNPNRYQFHNRVRSFYYGKEYVQALPISLFSAIRENILLFDNFPYWFIPSVDVRDIDSVLLLKQNNNSKTIKTGFLSLILGQTGKDSINCIFFDFEYRGTVFLAIPCINDVSSIRLVYKKGDDILININNSHLLSVQ